MIMQFIFLECIRIKSILIVFIGCVVSFPTLALAKGSTKHVQNLKPRISVISQQSSVAKSPVQLVVTDATCTMIHRTNVSSIHHFFPSVLNHQINIRNVIHAQGANLVRKRCGLHFVKGESFYNFKFIKVSDHSFIYDNQYKLLPSSDLNVSQIRATDFINLLREFHICAYVVSI